MVKNHGFWQKPWILVKKMQILAKTMDFDKNPQI